MKADKRGIKRKAQAVVSDDPRFAAMHQAPTFQRIKKQQTKVKIDPRFKAVMTDDRFRVIDGNFDKYGRRIKKGKRVVDDLRPFYSVGGEDEQEEVDQAGEDMGGGDNGRGRGRGRQLKGLEDEEDTSDDVSQGGDEADNGESTGAPDEELEHEGATQQAKRRNRAVSDKDGAGPKPVSRAEMEERLDYLNRLARGEISDVSTSSSDEDEDESEGQSDDDAESEVADLDGEDLDASRELDEEPIPMGEETRRLAVLKCDWDHMRAVDILNVLLSFKPEYGEIRSVTVYPSDYGLERMAEEAKLGPSFLRHGQRGAVNGAGRAEDDVADSDDAGDGLTEEVDEDVDDEIDQEQLRRYELQKLRYYFAVAEFDSKETANAVYQEVDGLEVEDSAVQIDARFVPGDTSFEGRQVRDRAEPSSVSLGYEPPKFVTKALQLTNVECTWDAGDEARERKLTQHHQWQAKEVEDDDLNAYLASSESESDGEASEAIEEKGKKGKEQQRKKLRAMLLGGLVGDEDSSSDEKGVNEKEADKDVVEMTYVPELADKLKEKAQKQKSVSEEREDADGKGETPWEAYQRKRKEKRREKKLQQKLEKQRARGEVDENGTADAEQDDFFVEEQEGGQGKKLRKSKHDILEEHGDEEADAGDRRKVEQELELMFAGDEQEKDARDFNMRELQRQEKVKGKKLKGKRKRKEESREAAPGQGFELDVQDPRFAPLFEGDARFGIDRTSKEFKGTEAMKVILAEQAKRSKAKHGDHGKRKQNVKGAADSLRASESRDADKARGDGRDIDNVEAKEKRGPSLTTLVQKFKKK